MDEKKIIREYEVIPLELTVITAKYQDVVIPDSPGLRRHLKLMEFGNQIFDMKKRYFFFFKRKLRPYEKAEELVKLQIEEIANIKRKNSHLLK